MLNPGVPKCDEDLITLDTNVDQGKQWITRFSYIYMPQYENINMFGYLGARGEGGECLKNKTGPILIHIYPLLYFNLHKYISWTKNVIVFGVMVGPYIKSRGTVGTKMSANADRITLETYVQQGIRKQSDKNFLSLNPKNMKKYNFCRTWGTNISGQ